MDPKHAKNSVSSEIAVATLALPPHLDMAAARALVSDLRQLRGRALDIDASAVERVGAQCLQALISANLTWAHDEVPFAIPATSPAFLEALALTGIGTAEIATEGPL